MKFLSIIWASYFFSLRRNTARGVPCRAHPFGWLMAQKIPVFRPFLEQNSRMSDPFTTILLRCPHVMEQILRGLDIKSIMQVKAVSNDMYNFVKTSKIIWVAILRRLSKRYFLILPKWKEIQQRFECHNYPQLCQEIMEYKWQNYCDPSISLINQHFIAIVYGDLKRLKFFWPTISDMEHPSNLLPYLVSFECTDCIQFFVTNVTNVKPYLTETLLRQAATCDYYLIVCILLPFYSQDGEDRKEGLTAARMASSRGFLETAKVIENWFL